MQPPLSQRLKAETRAAHDRIEARFDLDARLASRAAYAALLHRLHALHGAFEAAAAPHLAGTGLAPSPRAALIARDLAALGEPDRPAPLPGFADLVVDRASAAGAAYVVEGSSLGGLVIARAVERRLGLGPETGNAFFAGDGKATAARWRAFAAALDALSDPATDDAVVAAALATFALMDAWLAADASRLAA